MLTCKNNVKIPAFISLNTWDKLRLQPDESPPLVKTPTTRSSSENEFSVAILLIVRNRERFLSALFSFHWALMKTSMSSVAVAMTVTILPTTQHYCTNTTTQHYRTVTLPHNTTTQLHYHTLNWVVNLMYQTPTSTTS